MARSSKSVIVSASLLLAAGSLLGAQAQDPGSEFARVMERVEAWEERVNQRQPPAKVMDAVGVEAGMVIGELGAGRGRYTAHLAHRVGSSGKVYANDIDAEALSFLEQRCAQARITNVELILGEVEDAKFPDGALDMIFMVWVYHMVENPVPLLRSFGSSLRPGAPVVMVEPPPEEIAQEIEGLLASGAEEVNITVLDEAVVRDHADKAGFRLVRTLDDLLEKDIIYILEKR